MQPRSLLHAMASLLQSRTTLQVLQAESITMAAAFLLLFLVYVVALLQNRLIKASGHWQQHTASMFHSRNRTLVPKTNTTAAELYYLRHMRSCAATTMGNKGGNPSQRIVLQISEASCQADCYSVPGRLLQSIL